ncbi:unnamed protein product [Brassica oleracea var. botrytis]
MGSSQSRLLRISFTQTRSYPQTPRSWPSPLELPLELFYRHILERTQ